MKYQAGYVYHINDAYFEKVKDDKLMQNKEGGSFRPTFYCYRDVKTGLLWMVPLSSRVHKYQAIHDKQMAKYGNCLMIVIGDFAGEKAAFLLQNMFPVTESYLDHVHTRNGNPVVVNHAVRRQIEINMKQIFRLRKRGRKMVFPDIDRLEKLMLEECRAEFKAEIAKGLASIERGERIPAKDIKEEFGL